MNVDSKSQIHVDKNNTSSVKLPLLKSKETLLEKNTSDQPLSLLLISGDGSHISNSAVKAPDKIVIFEPLDEEGERYIKENLTLPPIEEGCGTKYYINIATKDGDLSSANSGTEWDEVLNYEEECCVASVRIPEQDDPLEMKTDEVNVNNKRNFPITKKTIMERKQNDQKTQEYIRAQVVSDLEKRMVSLYSLKKQYKTNIYSEGCEKKSIRLPPIVGHDRLTRQRDSMINRIRMKTKENDNKLRKQLDRKLEIVQKILKEQERNKVNTKNDFNEKIKGTKRTKNDYKHEQNNGPDEPGVVKNEQEYKIDFSDSAVDIRDKDLVIGNSFPDNVDFLSPAAPEAKLISDEPPEVEPGSVLKSPKKSVTSKKGKKKKKSLKGTDKAVSKTSKGKQKKV